MKKTKSIVAMVFAAALVIVSPAAGRAQDPYKEKTLTFIVGYSPGGTYYQYTRLIARHIRKHLPGNPAAIVENMPGAGGIIAANSVG